MPKRKREPQMLIEVKDADYKKMEWIKDNFREAMKRDQDIIINKNEITLYQKINGRWVLISDKPKPWWRFW